MKCIDCKFFKKSEEIDWSGICKISLPPHIHEAGNNFASWVTADAGCDLGQAEVQESAPTAIKGKAKAQAEE